MLARAIALVQRCREAELADGRASVARTGLPGEVGYTLFRAVPEPRMAADGAVPLEEFCGGRGVARRLRDTPPAVIVFFLNHRIVDGIVAVSVT